jgi:hypothetical protein
MPDLPHIAGAAPETNLTKLVNHLGDSPLALELV